MATETWIGSGTWKCSVCFDRSRRKVPVQHSVCDYCVLTNKNGVYGRRPSDASAIDWNPFPASSFHSDNRHSFGYSDAVTAPGSMNRSGLLFARLHQAELDTICGTLFRDSDSRLPRVLLCMITDYITMPELSVGTEIQAMDACETWYRAVIVDVVDGFPAMLDKLKRLPVDPFDPDSESHGLVGPFSFLFNFEHAAAKIQKCIGSTWPTAQQCKWYRVHYYGFIQKHDSWYPMDTVMIDFADNQLPEIYTSTKWTLSIGVETAESRLWRVQAHLDKAEIRVGPAYDAELVNMVRHYLVQSTYRNCLDTGLIGSIDLAIKVCKLILQDKKQ